MPDRAPEASSADIDPILRKISTWLSIGATFVRLLEHVPEKWIRFSDEDTLQHIELARILIDQAIPLDRNTR